MDEFGVLVKRYGINPNKGKSAPMAGSKKTPKPLNNDFNNSFVDQDLNFLSKPVSQSNIGNGSNLDYQNDDFFGVNFGNKGQNYDVFEMPRKNNSEVFNGGGLGFDFDVGSGLTGSGVKASSGSGGGGGDDIWGFSETKGGNVEVGSGDLLSSDPVDDFWGKMAKLSLDQRGVERLENKGFGDDLISGFGIGNTVNSRGQTSGKDTNSSFSSLDDLEEFATIGKGKGANGHGGSFTAQTKPEKRDKQKPLETNFFDFDASVNGDYVQKEETVKVDFMFQDEAPDLDMFFKTPPKKSAPIPGPSARNVKTPVEPNLFSGPVFGMDQKVSSSDYDFTSMFEGGSQASGVFPEIEGESVERRSLRFARYQRAKMRMEHALAEMNQREFKAQQEQEEKYRIADAMEMEMKQWAAGKEGNLRALISSLQQVLGPETGWRPVSITDLITSSQVKIAYRKAALCVHPDKVQQRGADLHQKYVAEKTFDLLQEAWNKFSTDELR